MTVFIASQDYNMTMPYAHCKGILMGTMTMELGGKVCINCEKTGYSTEMEFKLRPFLGGGELTNAVSGRIKIGKETIAVIEGHWDETVTITDKKTGHKEVLWQVSQSEKYCLESNFTVQPVRTCPIIKLEIAVQVTEIFSRPTVQVTQ